MPSHVTTKIFAVTGIQNGRKKRELVVSVFWSLGDTAARRPTSMIRLLVGFLLKKSDGWCVGIGKDCR